MTLSVCLIVKDEQAVIGRCLNCAASFADEIIVVDTGSQDNTVAEVKKFTDKVYFFTWCDDFSAARNFAFEKATCDLVMWLDADDIITEENCLKIQKLKDDFKDYDMAVLPYAAAFDGDTPTFVYSRERIFRRDKNYRFSGAVHEAVVPCGKILYSDAAIYHKKVKEGEPMRNLRILQKQIAAGKELDARQKFYYGRELLFNGMFREAAAVLEDFLLGDGWIVNKTEACLNIYYAYKSLNREDRAIAALLRGFTFAPPQSQACCILGEYFMNKEEWKTAVYWYETAIAVSDNGAFGSFVNLDYGGFIPYMQLCVLYDKLGDRQKAAACNEAAGRIKPLNENYLNNKKYFEKLGIRGNDK
ncbi:MAG: glycosyltransferase family 2 protein [Clostridia bacterium]|nr:glycosyltransferase family 2 protein [Clostridia bacterium]